jgi:hypothetical protein
VVVGDPRGGGPKEVSVGWKGCVAFATTEGDKSSETISVVGTSMGSSGPVFSAITAGFEAGSRPMEATSSVADMVTGDM